MPCIPDSGVFSVQTYVQSLAPVNVVVQIDPDKPVYIEIFDTCVPECRELVNIIPQLIESYPKLNILFVSVDTMQSTLRLYRNLSGLKNVNLFVDRTGHLRYMMRKHSIQLPSCIIYNTQSQIQYIGSQFTEGCHDVLNKLSGLLTKEETEYQELMLSEQLSEEEKQRRREELKRQELLQEEMKQKELEEEMAQRRMIVLEDERPVYLISSVLMLHEVEKFYGEPVMLYYFSTSQARFIDTLKGISKMTLAYPNVYFMAISQESPAVLVAYFNYLRKTVGVEAGVSVASDHRAVFRGFIAKHQQTSFGTAVLFNISEQICFMGNTLHSQEQDRRMQLMTGNTRSFAETVEELNGQRPRFLQIKLRDKRTGQTLNVLDQYMLFNEQEEVAGALCAQGHARQVAHARAGDAGPSAKKYIVVEFIPDFQVARNIHCYKGQEDTARYLRQQVYNQCIPVFRRLNAMTQQFPEFYILAVSNQSFATLEQIRTEFPILRTVNIAIRVQQLERAQFRLHHAIIFNVNGNVYWQGYPSTNEYTRQIRMIQRQIHSMERQRGRQPPSKKRTYKKYYQRHTGQLSQKDVELLQELE